jgi:hypothetical protein
MPGRQTIPCPWDNFASTINAHAADDGGGGEAMLELTDA